MTAPVCQDPAERCAGCTHFLRDRAAIEALVPNLTVFGSAYASVAWDSGLCRNWDAFRSPRDTCAAYRDASR
jgi:hypothetical protein